VGARRGRSPERRSYRLRKRAQQQERTRARIVDALVELHRTVGPAKTTVTEVAELAEVGRMTVYNHFPTEGDMIEACSAHWVGANPPPDPDVWSRIHDPAERLEAALRDLYRYYRRNRDMLGRVLRDEPIVPPLADVMKRAWWPMIDDMIRVLAHGRRLRGTRRARVEAALRLVLDFATWRTVGTLGDEEAARVAAGMVESVT